LSGITCLQNFMKIYLVVKKLLVGATQMHRLVMPTFIFGKYAKNVQGNCNYLHNHSFQKLHKMVNLMNILHVMCILICYVHFKLNNHSI
jgi:hypothetical protein